MKSLFFITLVALTLTSISCSKSDGSSSSLSNTSCNDIVCGYTMGSGGTTYVLYRGTLNPDTCGQTQLVVNAATYNYYKNKITIDNNTTHLGYVCWEGTK